MPNTLTQQRARKRLRKIIRTRGTQRAAAAELDIHPATLSAILSGKDRPSLDLATRIQKTYGVPATDFSEVA